MSNPLPTPGVKGRLFFSNGGDNGEACLAVDTGSSWKRIVLDNSVGATSSKMALLEADKTAKDTRVAALESDKNEKDTKISDMESDMTSLTSRVSTLESSGFDTSDLATKVSLGNLATRVSSLETLGIKGISNAVSWTNLTEINVGGQTITSGGTVQAYAGGGLEKISGTSGFNAGASSVQKIDGNSDGYVQFQWNSNSVRVGLKYSDTDYDVDTPHLQIASSNNTVGTKSVSPGDWFRIRHYASTNEIKYQRKETVYSQNPNFVFETASGSDYQYISTERPTVISLDGTGTLTIGEVYKVYTVRASDQALYLRDFNGNAHGYHSQGLRGVRFEVAEEAGQDYVSFYTEPTLTNGNDLYVDVSLYHVGARINDVTIVT